jgi:hypothetical protein
VGEWYFCGVSIQYTLVHAHTPFFHLFYYTAMRTFRLLHRAAIFLAMVALIAGAASCGGGSATPTQTKTELLTRAGGWTFDKFTTGSLGPGDAAYPGMVMKFTSSGSMTITPSPAAIAAIKALGADLEPSYTGTWSFNSSETIVTFNAPPLFSAPLRVAELSSTTLRLTGSVPGTTQTLESQWTGK